MAVYTHTISAAAGTASEFSLFYRKSGKWGNYSYLWDGSITSAPSTQDNPIGIKYDMSWLPSGMRICGINVGIAYKRTGSGGKHVWLRSTDATSEPGVNNYYEIADPILPTGTYNENEWHTAHVDIDAEHSALFLARTTKYIVFNGQANELSIEFEYTESDSSKTYNGVNKASAIYVGSNKGSMYVGTTKVL